MVNGLYLYWAFILFFYFFAHSRECRALFTASCSSIHSLSLALSLYHTCTHAQTHSHTTLEELHFKISCTYFSSYHGAFKWMWWRFVFYPLSIFTLIKYCSTLAFDLFLIPIELRECSSSFPGVWMWDLLPANDPGTVSNNNDYDRLQIIFCNA